MRDNDIESVLRTIVSRTGQRKIRWRLEGSCNLRIQGVDVSVRDIDIETDGHGLKAFREILSDCIVRDFYNEKIKCNSIICILDDFEVEIVACDDENISMLDRSEPAVWRGISLNILPLEHAAQFYSALGRAEKVGIIDKYTNSFTLPRGRSPALSV